MKMRAYAKINLFLDVVGKRPDGYHDIISVMQKINLFDEVTVTPREGEGDILIRMSTDEVACDSSNLAYRAARLFFNAIGMTPWGLEIHIEKNIPIAAGLAGGSADAAAVLTCLNQMYRNPLSPQQLQAIGRTIGADVPFCLAEEGAMLTEGIGDVMTPISPLPPCYLLLCTPKVGVSTPKAYQKLDEKYDHFGIVSLTVICWMI